MWDIEENQAHRKETPAAILAHEAELSLSNAYNADGNEREILVNSRVTEMEFGCTRPRLAVKDGPVLIVGGNQRLAGIVVKRNPLQHGGSLILGQREICGLVFAREVVRELRLICAASRDENRRETGYRV